MTNPTRITLNGKTYCVFPGGMIRNAKGGFILPYGRLGQSIMSAYSDTINAQCAERHAALFANSPAFRAACNANEIAA